MTKTAKNPASKSKGAASQKDAATKKRAAKDAAPTAAKAPRPPRARRPRDPRLPAVGATIQRSYKGRVHEVTVREDGFLYEGETYRSLSALARKVTGFAAVNGFLWWGLTPAKKPTDAESSIATKPTKGTPEQLASVARARAARAAKVAARRAARASS